MAILPSLNPTTYKGLDEYLKTRKELGQTDKRSPFFKNLPDVVINIPKKKETSPMQGVPKPRRVLGIPEPLFFSLLGGAALVGVIYLSVRGKEK